MAGLEFDPGFAPFILAFRGTVEYLYMDINRFKNLSQRKMKFKQYYKKFIALFICKFKITKYLLHILTFLNIIFM